MRLPKIILASGLLVVLATYSMGWSGTLHFDDEPNLQGLSGVSDFASGLRFVLSGDSGPTGRPLSLVTFVLQHESWPDPSPFLIFNSVLHILNAVLCFLLLRRLLGWMLEDRRAAAWLAVIVTLVWAASPFLASSNLMVVQRMTGLSAFFALLALNIYSVVRTGYRLESLRSNLWLAFIAGIGTLLAGLAKENGFLLPAFLLLIEWLLVANARVTIKPLHKGFFWIVLISPVAVTLGYLLYKGFASNAYLYRDFSLIERLLTQPRALLDYIFNLLVPATESITPFHDGYQHSMGLLEPITTLLSFLAVAVSLVLAWLFRRRIPLVAFGLLWFFAGHLVESTVLALELYFPHRNYFPAIGFYLAVVCMFWHVFRSLRVATWLSACAAVGSFLFFSAVLGLGTSLWGKPQVAAELWYIENRKSIRAAINIFNYYMGSGELPRAAQLNEEFIQEHPDKALFAIQSLAICDQNQLTFKEKMRRALIAVENEKKITGNLSEAIRRVSAVSKESGCPYLGIEQAQQLVQAALCTRVRRLVHPSARQHLLFAQAQLADHNGEYGKAIEALQQAMDIEPHLDAVLLIAYFYVQQDDLESAIDYLEQILSDTPVDFPLEVVWKSRLQTLLDSLR